MDKLNTRQKLQKVQCELKAPKNQYNKFAGFYYRNAEDIQEALKPLQEKYGFTTVLEDKIEMVGERYYIKAIATFMDTENNDIITTTAYAREQEDKKGMDSAQVSGSTSSYARKYALNALFLIDDTKDADSQDNTAMGQTEGNKAKSQTASPQAMAYQERQINKF